MGWDRILLTLPYSSWPWDSLWDQCLPFQLDTPKPTSSGFVSKDRLLQSRFRNSM